MTDALVRKRRMLASLGIETEHVSGICSRGPWVEAALAAGFVTTNGGVAYCATSMDPDLLFAEAEWVLDCETPSECHDPPPLDDDRRFHPFYARSSGNRMISEAGAGLLIISSESAHSLPCLDISLPREPDTCVASDADIEVIERDIVEYVAARESGRATTLVYSWSMGPLQPEGFGTNLVATVGEAVARGDLVWAGVDTIGAMVDQSATLR